MAATTISVQQILMYLASELDESRDARLTNVVGNDLTTDLTDTTTNLYVGALVEIPGKGIQTVTAYDGTLKKVTVAGAFNPVAATGDRMQIAWWKSRKRGRAFRAVQEAVRLAYPYWYRETFVLAAAATITLANYTYVYALPTDVTELFRVGIDDGTGLVHWCAPENVWRVIGEPGAFSVRFLAGPRWQRGRTWTSYGGVNYADRYAGQKLCLHYAAAEPVPADETVATVELPLDYFRVASALYDRRLLRTATQFDLQRYNTSLPQSETAAHEALAHLGLIKQRPPMPLYGILDQ